MDRKPILVLCHTEIDDHCPMFILPLVNLLCIVYCAAFPKVSILLSDRIETRF